MAGSGAGSRLPTPVLFISGVSAAVAVLVSLWSILLQLRNYRKPALQRMVVRIMLMVPLYAIASLISLFSLEAAFVIDAIRDIYEAFVIYCFFVLLLSYLGGERSLLIMLHGRPPKEPPFPINFVKHEIDVSDPHTFLFLKRGILQYVQVKPVLAAATLILKAVGKYNEGDFRANSGYLYISIVYNISICLALYCLAIFWMCVNDDLKPFRPVPKFLCVKGILFFSFWQSIGISILVAASVITRLGPYTDAEHVSVGLNDLLICIEMPFFAFAHMYAFSHRDYIDLRHTFVARMRIYNAFRDAFGIKDVVEDTKVTLRGEGMDYREFEPAEGVMHQGIGRERRIKAGLRYSKGGQQKYWLPKTQEDSQAPGRAGRMVNNVIRRVAGDDDAGSVHAPLLAQEAEHAYHLAPDMQSPSDEPSIWDYHHSSPSDPSEGYSLPFGDIDQADEDLFANSRRFLFGDYNYPVIDVSSEDAKIVIWDEEERVLRDERGAWFSFIRGAKGKVALERREAEGPVWKGYGAVLDTGGPAIGRGKGRQLYDDDDDDGGVANGRPSVVDYEADRSTVPSHPGDLNLRWQKTHQHPSSRSRSPHIRPPSSNLRPSPSYVPGPSSSASSPGTTHPSSSSPASSSGARSRTNTHSPKLAIKTQPTGNLLRSPPSISRTNSAQSQTNGKKKSPLPPDAVDLVVEDRRASPDESRRQRRGDVATGLRRVYSGADDEGGRQRADSSSRRRDQNVVEVRHPQPTYNAPPPNRRAWEEDVQDGTDYPDAQPNVNVVVRPEPSRDQESGWGVGGGYEVQVDVHVNAPVVATSTTPPLHARVEQYDFGGTNYDADHNPWA